MESLAIIPARGGSKRLPRKNLRPLGGRPLVRHTLDAAVESGCFTRVVLSSDDDEILAQADEVAGVEPWPRPAALSGDHVTALTLVESIVVDDGLADAFDVVSLLLPTAPFRRAEHLRAGFEMLDRSVDGVVSLTDYEFPPQLSVTRDDAGLVHGVWDPCPLVTGDTRSQDQARIHRPNGAFYVRWMDRFLADRNFWKGKVRGYLMERRESVDIDDERDLAWAQFLLDREGDR
jgi:CMP-N-acetylneuraminic acid synthetase